MTRFLDLMFLSSFRHRLSCPRRVINTIGKSSRGFLKHSVANFAEHRRGVYTWYNYLIFRAMSDTINSVLRVAVFVIFVRVRFFEGGHRTSI